MSKTISDLLAEDERLAAPPFNLYGLIPRSLLRI